MAQAQTKPEATLTDADRAKRDADKVFRFIKLQAQRPAAAPAAVAVVAQAPAAAKVLVPTAPVRVAAASPVAATVIATSAVQSPSLEAAPALSATSSVAATPAVLPVAAAVVTTAAPLVAPVAAVPPPETEEIELALLTHVQPELPNNRLGNLRNGSVWVQFTVEPDGRTNNVLARPGGQMRLAQSAVRAVQQWRFAPITEARDVAVEIAFKLD